MHTVTVGVIAGLITGAVVGATVIAPYVVPPDQHPVQESNVVAEVTAISPDSSEEPPEPKVSWTVAAAYPTALPHLGSMAAAFERRLWRVSDGSFEVHLREPAAGAKPEDPLAELAAGRIDALFTTPAQWTEHSPALQLFGATPFGMDARAFLAWMESGGGKALLDETLLAEGLSGVMCGMAAAQGAGWFRKPLRTPEDFRGLKMRIVGLGSRVMARLGALPVATAGGELLAALDGGEIDAAAFSLPSIDTALQLQTLLKHYYFPGWHAPATAFYLIVPAERWAALDPALRTRLEAVCGENVGRSMAEGDAAQFPALRTLARRGVDVRRLPPEILESLRTTWDAVADEESSRDAAFRKVIASMRAFETDHRVWRELSAP